MEEIRESAENIGGILDDIWRITTSPYSQERMVHIFDIIGMYWNFVICTKERDYFLYHVGKSGS